nr:MAG: hypothetical protein [Podoviridae sp. ctka020]
MAKTLREAIDIARQDPNSEKAQKLAAALYSGKMDEMAAKEGIDLTDFKKAMKEKLSPHIEVPKAVTKAIDIAAQISPPVGAINKGIEKVEQAINTPGTEERAYVPPSPSPEPEPRTAAEEKRRETAIEKIQRAGFTIANDDDFSTDELEDAAANQIPKMNIPGYPAPMIDVASKGMEKIGEGVKNILGGEQPDYVPDEQDKKQAALGVTGADLPPPMYNPEKIREGVTEVVQGAGTVLTSPAGGAISQLPKAAQEGLAFVGDKILEVPARVVLEAGRIGALSGGLSTPPEIREKLYNPDDPQAMAEAKTAVATALIVLGLMKGHEPPKKTETSYKVEIPKEKTPPPKASEFKFVDKNGNELVGKKSIIPTEPLPKEGVAIVNDVLKKFTEKMPTIVSRSEALKGSLATAIYVGTQVGLKSGNIVSAVKAAVTSGFGVLAANEATGVIAFLAKAGMELGKKGTAAAVISKLSAVPQQALNAADTAFLTAALNK